MRSMSFVCLAALLWAGCASVEEDQSLAPEAATVESGTVEVAEVQLEEEFERPTVRYYVIADT